MYIYNIYIRIICYTFIICYSFIICNFHTIYIHSYLWTTDFSQNPSQKTSTLRQSSPPRKTWNLCQIVEICIPLLETVTDDYIKAMLNYRGVGNVMATHLPFRSSIATSGLKAEGGHRPLPRPKGLLICWVLEKGGWFRDTEWYCYKGFRHIFCC